MAIHELVRRELNGYIESPGCYVSVDGQFGSTGKGVINGLMAELFWPRVHWVLSNAGPNSGHTSFLDDEKIVLKQLPTFGVTSHKLSLRDKRFPPPNISLTAGAVIHPHTLEGEIRDHLRPELKVTVDPSAAWIADTDILEDGENVKGIASTGKGIGPSLIRKMKRERGGVLSQVDYLTDNVPWYVGRHYAARWDVAYMEVSQGYSLGINSGFYPHVTSRECTVSQALSDAGLPPSAHRSTIMSVRTYPIRVGSTQNSSGPCYSDQHEISWSDLGVKPELTTVTQRVRRVFTWSTQQFMDAVAANDPDVIFLNFMNYLNGDDAYDRDFVHNNLLLPYRRVTGRSPRAILLGYGPRSEDVRTFQFGSA